MWTLCRHNHGQATNTPIGPVGRTRMGFVQVTAKGAHNVAVRGREPV